MKRKSRITRCRRRNSIFASSCLALLLTSCAISGHRTTASILHSSVTIGGASAGSQWQLVWQDNFDGTGQLTKWTPDTGGYGFGDQQLEWNSKDNAALSGHGGLIITAEKGASGHTCWYGPCKYTAAKIQTTFSQAYGRFEARMKLPAGAGLWPAFWMIPANPRGQGEIDVLETNNTQPYLVTGYAHDGKASPLASYTAETVLNLPISSQYHTYGVDWSPTGITWTLDGQAYGHMAAYKGWPFNQPFIMLLDLAVGGTWPGAPTSSTVFPAQMLVQWVRVYKAVGLPEATSSSQRGSRPP